MLAVLTGRYWEVEIEKNIGLGAYHLGEKTLLFKINVYWEMNVFAPFCPLGFGDSRTLTVSRVLTVLALSTVISHTVISI